MRSCKEVSELVSQSLDRKLPFWTRMGVWMHLGMCRLCWGFRRQLLMLREAARRNAEKIAGEEGPTLSQAAHQRIRRALEDRPG